MTEFDDLGAYAEASEAYLKAFGEAPPLKELPRGPAAALETIRAALAAGRPYESTLPADAQT